MAKYAVFFTYTSDTWARMIKKPRRPDRGGAAAGRLGGRLA
jgi:hypothetical protein